MTRLKVLIPFFVMIIYGNTFGQIELTLEESREMAFKNNAELNNARLETEAAAKIKNSAFTHYFPGISAGGMIFENTGPLMEMETSGGNLPVYDGDPANLANPAQFAFLPGGKMGLLEKGQIGYINVIQPLFAGGRIYNGNRLAALGKNAAEYKMRLTKNSISLKTEKLFWQIISLEEKMKTILKFEELLNSLNKQVSDGYQSGLLLKNDLLKVKLKESEIRLNKTKLADGIKLVKMAFSQHIGLAYDSLLTLRGNLELTDLPQSLYVDNENALNTRDEFRLLKLSLKAEELQTNMKLGEYLPRAGIGVSGQYIKLDEGEGNTVGVLFGTISLPLSDWWGGYYELQERSIKEKISKNNLRNSSELLMLQMEKAWQDFESAYRQYLLNLESKAQAEENLRLNEDSYKNGLITLSDLLEAQATLQNAEDRLTESIAEYKTKKRYYLQVTGR